MKKNLILLFAVGLLVVAADLRAQITPVPAILMSEAARDSLSDSLRAREFLLRLDSIMDAAAAEESTLKQVASQREMDIDGDGQPEMFRISGWVEPEIENTKIEFTIKRRKKVLWKDSWNAGTYFEPNDHLSRAVKLHRLRKIVNAFFANENFLFLDSAGFKESVDGGAIADIALGSKEWNELVATPRLTFSVLAGREYWYGLAWLASKQKLVRAWRN